MSVRMVGTAARYRVLWAVVGLAACLGLGWADEDVKEFWDAIQIGKQKVGYIHTAIDRVDKEGQLVIHVKQQTHFSLRRFNDLITMEALFDAFELPDGLLYGFNWRMKMAQNEQSIVGRLDRDLKMNLTIATLNKKSQEQLSWSREVLGPYGTERILREQPLEVGQSRGFLTFVPELNQVVRCTLKAEAFGPTELIDGMTRELLRVGVELDVPNFPPATNWLDPKTRTIVKTEMKWGGLALTSYRVSKAQALDQPADQAIDLGFSTLVKPDQPAPQAHSRAVRYRLEFGSVKGASDFPAAAYQKILHRSGKTVEVLVGPHVEGAPRSPAPGPEYLESNSFLQSDDPQIKTTADEVVGAEKEPWRQATRLEAWVKRAMQQVDFTVGFATASEVLQTRRGDCTEHAVLLAALCRAAKLPARVATGLVYLEHDGRFGYHMWTEVYVGGQWRALDGTLGRGGIQGGHLKLNDASLKGASAMASFLSIFEVIGQLKIHVLELGPVAAPPP